jgi:aldose 1-epimerase
MEITRSPYADAVAIENENLRLVVSPTLGAAVLRFDQLLGSDWVPLLRPTPTRIETVFDCAMNLMLPWVNRISGGGFFVGERFFSLSPNLEGEPFPIHGNAFQSVWRIAGGTASELVLGLSSDGPGPYRYQATCAYSLSGGVLTVDLSVTNSSHETVPFGLGLHPWFPRTRGLPCMRPLGLSGWKTRRICRAPPSTWSPFPRSIFGARPDCPMVGSTMVIRDGRE